MTKQEIINDIKWRLSDCKQQYEFWMKKLSELPNQEEAVRHTKFLTEMATKRKQSGELFAFTEAVDYMKQWENDTNSAHYNAFLNLVQYDILERLYNTIMDEEKKK